MDIFVLAVAGLLALAIIVIKIKQIKRDLLQDESRGCCFCKSCSDSSCQDTES